MYLGITIAWNYQLSELPSFLDSTFTLQGLMMALLLRTKLKYDLTLSLSISPDILYQQQGGK